MNTKQRAQTRWVAWVLLFLGPVSATTFLAIQGTELDMVQMALMVSMLLPSFFGLAVLLLLNRMSEQWRQVNP